MLALTCIDFLCFVCCRLLAALSTFGQRLTEFEQEEILDYSDVHYLGLEAPKIVAVRNATQNHGKERCAVLLPCLLDCRACIMWLVCFQSAIMCDRKCHLCFMFSFC